MSAATVSRWSRLFVVASLGWLVCWQAAVVLGGGRRLAVVLGLYGFVFHMVFGKAYALIPSYFDRELAAPRAGMAHLPLAVVGTAGMAADAAGIAETGTVGSLAWAGGVAVFLVAIAATIRDNPTGAETGTAEAKPDHRSVDRVANAAVPVALAYLLAGAASSVVATAPVAVTSTAAVPNAVVRLLPLGGPPTTHLFAAGTATLLVFALGLRLLPRFLAVTPRQSVAWVVLPAGAIGPALIATGFGSPGRLQVGAGLQTVALVGFAVAYVDLFRRSQRRRVGLYTVLLGALAGAAVGVLGVQLAVAGATAGVVEAHVRIALLGFLGLSIVGVSYQFYPPTVAATYGVGNRTAGVAVGLLAGGVAVETTGHLAGVAPAVTGGRLLALAGAVVHASLLIAVFAARANRGR